VDESWDIRPPPVPLEDLIQVAPGATAVQNISVRPVWSGRNVDNSRHEAFENAQGHGGRQRQFRQAQIQLQLHGYASTIYAAARALLCVHSSPFRFKDFFRTSFR